MFGKMMIDRKFRLFDQNFEIRIWSFDIRVLPEDNFPFRH